MSTFSAQSKPRNRGPNTKAGCTTCKIRRKRCDQTKPACLRCSSTGRSCDFLSSPPPPNTSSPYEYEQFYWRPEVISSPPSLLQFESSVESTNFDYFLSECTQEFSTFFHASLWQELVVQAAHSEPFILHAVLAIGALRRMQLHQATSTNAEYITKKYTLALRILRRKLSEGTVDIILAALGSLVFLAIEVLQGHEQEAIIHIRSGEAILKSLHIHPSTSNSISTNPSHPTPPLPLTPTSSKPEIISDDIITAFTRLSTHEDLFLPSSSSSSSSSPNTTALPTLPSSLKDIASARTALNAIMAATYTFFRRNGDEGLKTLPFAPLPPSISEEYSRIRNTLGNWCRLFRNLSLDLSSKSSETHKNVLLVYHYVTSIRLSTYFHPTELIYDLYTSQFQTVIDLSSQIIAHQNDALYGEGKAHGPCYTLNLAIAQPLFFVARKCRDLTVRRRAIEEMKEVGSEREGIYTGRNVARVAEWVVGVECGGLEVSGFVSEEKRLGDVRFEFERQGMVAMVDARRRVTGGGFEVLRAELDLS